MSGRQKPRRGLLTRTSRVSRHPESQTQETVARRRFRETGFRFGVDGTRSRLRARVGTHRAAVRAAGGEVCVERRDASGRGVGHDSCGAWGLAKRGDLVTRGEDNNALRVAGMPAPRSGKKTSESHRHTNPRANGAEPRFSRNRKKDRARRGSIVSARVGVASGFARPSRPKSRRRRGHGSAGASRRASTSRSLTRWANR